MDLDQLKNNWQEQELRLESENLGYDKIIAFDKGLEKENLSISILFAATIFFVGVFVLPLLKSTTEQLLVGALFFLMGIQGFLFWMRSLNVRKSFGETPREYIRSLIKKLKYNLSVTRVIVPLYVVLLGTIVSLYAYELLSSFDIDMVYIVIVIVLSWAYFIGIFIYGWRKQRKKDHKIIIPMIAELEETLKNY
ncbi:MAG: hypothetical protein AAFR87_06545 [Bacteroidota bacterium]